MRKNRLFAATLALFALSLFCVMTACGGKTVSPIPVIPAPGEEPESPVEGIKFTYSIHPDNRGGDISPYIYGSNVDKSFSHSDKDPTTLVRLGGNRTTGYNWENNASNAGSDWQHYSDNYLASSVVAGSNGTIPGSVAKTFVTNSLNAGQTPLFTIPISYSVAADMNGIVLQGDATRWKTNKARKDAPFSLKPDLTDESVYADECVNFITDIAGGKGKVMYSLDNEPDLWQHTHPMICPEHIGCEEFLDRTVDFAKSIKEVDEQSTIFGLVSFGYSGFVDFAGAPDWGTLKGAGNYDWFIDYFLDRVKRESDVAGRTLVDVLDLHWYPEARGDERIVGSSANSTKDRKARLQAPRSLWDETYKEDSWITDTGGGFLPLLPKVQASINKYCPEIKIAFTEFQYGGYEDITGTIALADVLGVFGKYGVFASNHWGHPGSYGLLAYDLYRNYDGNKSTFGDVSVECSMDKTWENSSIYASVSSESPAELHLIVTNKYDKDNIAAHFNLNSDTSYSNATVYIVSEENATIRKAGDVEVEENSFAYSLPPMSAAHIVIR
jgi:mannan endo-1,4-beta-mannosidase